MLINLQLSFPYKVAVKLLQHCYKNKVVFLVEEWEVLASLPRSNVSQITFFNWFFSLSCDDENRADFFDSLRYLNKLISLFWSSSYGSQNKPWKLASMRMTSALVSASWMKPWSSDSTPSFRENSITTGIGTSTKCGTGQMSDLQLGVG